MSVDVHLWLYLYLSLCVRVCTVCSRLQVTLVDHNRLASSQTFLKPCVTSVIDHHAMENVFPEAMCTIKLIGSCSSLVANFGQITEGKSEGGNKAHNLVRFVFPTG